MGWRGVGVRWLVEVRRAGLVGWLLAVRLSFLSFSHRSKLINVTHSGRLNAPPLGSLHRPNARRTNLSFNPTKREDYPRSRPRLYRPERDQRCCVGMSGGMGCRWVWEVGQVAQVSFQILFLFDAMSFERGVRTELIWARCDRV